MEARDFWIQRLCKTVRVVLAWVYPASAVSLFVDFLDVHDQWCIGCAEAVGG